MADPPNSFLNPLERWIYNKHATSIVSVELRPNSKKVLERWNAVAPISHGTPEHKKRTADSKQSVHCTGCVLGVDQNGRLLILTCAHGLGPVFSSEKPISAGEIEELYQPYVMCDHREQRFLNGEDLERVCTRAYFAEIDCESDLLLLKVSPGHMMHYCTEPHNPVYFGNRTAKELRSVVMLSWPWRRNRTAVTGHISHRGRNITDLFEANPFDFKMKLAEIDLTSYFGSSGAPLFDGGGKGVGVLHGGDRTFSYSIPLRVVRQTLAQWGWEMYADE